MTIKSKIEGKFEQQGQKDRRCDGLDKSNYSVICLSLNNKICKVRPSRTTRHANAAHEPSVKNRPKGEVLYRTEKEGRI